MKRIIFTLSASVCLSTSTPIAAQDIDAGRALARQCSVCHGREGVSNDPEVPIIAGQHAFYLEKSLKDYRDGIRDDRRMTLVAKSLSNEDIKDLAAWFASLSMTGAESN